MSSSYLENQGFSRISWICSVSSIFDYKDKDSKASSSCSRQKSDDYDEVYLNGKLIGSTGKIKDPKIQQHIQSKSGCKQVYVIPNGLIRTDRPNILAVRILMLFNKAGFIPALLPLKRPPAKPSCEKRMTKMNELENAIIQ
ncbi:MAG: hypothetical protein IPG53_11930 [Ignavibacteriales bacterium]|nr:hypothetical protein [Ignavibacteriales bacterium]